MNPAPSLYLNVIKMYFIKVQNQIQNSFDKEIILNKIKGAG